jgi:N-methylhydantoinase A
MRYRLAVDVGGTFIDYVLLDEETAEIAVEKQRAAASRLAEEVVEGMRRLPIPANEIKQLFHGTTVALNTLLQGKGAKVGLLTTAGFRDILEIGRGGRPEMYNFLYIPPEPLVPRYLRREVVERMTPDGETVVPLDTQSVDREVETLVAHGVEALAICFLHAYANPAHEQEAARRIREQHPDLPVTASSDVVREWREYDRACTTVVNARLRPFFARYVEELDSRLAEAGVRRPLALMQSNGGAISAARAALLPVRTLDSGPAGGVIGARALTAELGLRNVICTDVGGTSYDVALIHEGEILEKTLMTVADRPILGSAIEIESIGAGGGSIAWIDHRGSLRVGPQSAGAEPGPACFGLGGELPTVTDCHLVLGRLDPGSFLGARMALDVDAAWAAIDTQLCGPTGLGRIEAAAGVLAIAETGMTYAIRLMTVERGLDPREFSMLAYGGGGGLFAAATAEALEINTVIVPRAAANFSAWGILTSDYREDVVTTNVRVLTPENTSSIVSEFQSLTGEAISRIAEYGFSAAEIGIEFRADLRYEQQEHTVTVAVEADWLLAPGVFGQELREAFVARHRQLYGHGQPTAPIEIVTLRARAIGGVKRPAPMEWPQMPDASPAASRETYFPEQEQYLTTPVYQRDTLGRGAQVGGPAIVEEWTTTILVPPGWRGVIDRLGDVVLQRRSRSRR